MIRSQGLKMAWMVMVGVLACSCSGHQRENDVPRARLIVDKPMRLVPPSGGEPYPYYFLEVAGLAMDSAGRVLVLDGGTGGIETFTSEGLHERSLARYKSQALRTSRACCATVGADGGLWYIDRLSKSYVRLDLDTRTFTDVAGLPELTASGLMTRVIWTPHGDFVLYSDVFAEGRFRIARRVLNGSGVVISIDTLRESQSDSASSINLTDHDGDAITRVDQPYGPRPLKAFGPNGEIATAVSSQYSVTWVDGSGAVLHLIERDVEGPRITSDERKAAERSLAVLKRRFAMKTLPFSIPARKAPLASLGFDLDGNLWVERSVKQNEPRTADVYGRDGRWTLQVEWPRPVRLDLWTIQHARGLAVLGEGFSPKQVVSFHLVEDAR